MYPIVIIEWEDSAGFDGWADLEEIVTTQLSYHHAIGWLLHETDEAMYITQSYDDVNENYGAVQVIARSAIKKVHFPLQAMLTVNKDDKVV